jgi:hypothetical protein
LLPALVALAERREPHHAPILAAEPRSDHAPRARLVLRHISALAVHRQCRMHLNLACSSVPALHADLHVRAEPPQALGERPSRAAPQYSRALQAYHEHRNRSWSWQLPAPSPLAQALQG